MFLIRAIRGQFSPFVHHALPRQYGFFEIEEQRDLQTGDVQIPQHLGDVRIVECRDHFGICDDFAVHDQIGDQLADELAPIVNRIFALLLDRMAAFPQFDHQRVFIQLLIQPRLEFIQHHHRGTDNIFSNFFVKHQ